MLNITKWHVPLADKVLSPERQALLAAADYIDTHGWCQVAFRSGWGPVCPVEALNLLYGRGSPVGAAARRLFFDRYDETLMYWNDAPGRTKQQVVAALRATAFSAD